MSEYLVKRADRPDDDGSVVRIVADLGERAVVQVGETTFELSIRTLPDGRTAVGWQEERHALRTFTDRKQLVVVTGSEQRRFEVVDAREHYLHAAHARTGATGGRITASMPGRVVRIPVQVGDIVAPGAVVAVLEAMKMENDVRAPGGGKVVSIAVREGATVENGAILLQLEAAS